MLSGGKPLTSRICPAPRGLMDDVGRNWSVLKDCDKAVQLTEPANFIGEDEFAAEFVVGISGMITRVPCRR
jgi:hypothetical protein